MFTAMKLKIYQVDAFTSHLFSGNPAAVIPLEKWLDEGLMQNIAMENNLAETSFFVPRGKELPAGQAGFDLRWFTPAFEIDLCGHATLASGFILYNYLGYNKPAITFNTRSGPLFIRRENDILLMDFPSWKPERVTEYPPELLPSLGNPEIMGVYRNRDWLVELNNEETLRKIQPDFTMMKKFNGMVIVTAPGKTVDFVSRFFAPSAGIDEDPVTGSAHSQLIPFWSYKLGKEKMVARQLSKRGGEIQCEQKGNRVMMGGQCVFYMHGEVWV